MTRAPIYAALALALVGCAIPEENFPDTYGKAVCKRLRECDKGSFENSYDDLADCVDTWSRGAEFFLDAGGLFGGEYSPSKARTCINEINAASCGDFSSGSYECDVFE